MQSKIFSFGQIIKVSLCIWFTIVWRIHLVHLYCHADANKSLDVFATFLQKAGRMWYANIRNSPNLCIRIFGFLYPCNVPWSCEFSIDHSNVKYWRRKMSDAQSEYYDTQIQRYPYFHFHWKYSYPIFKIKTKISKQFSASLFCNVVLGRMVSSMCQVAHILRKRGISILWWADRNIKKPYAEMVYKL